MKSINALLAGLAIVVLGGAALLPAEARQNRAKQPTTKDIDAFAKRIMDQFEAKLMEQPTDGKFGMTRMMMVTVPTHTGVSGEIKRERNGTLDFAFTVSAFSLGRLDPAGNASRIRVSGYYKTHGWESLDAKEKKLREPVLKRVKTDTKALIKSANRDFKSWAITGDNPVTVYSRAILPKKECLSCHTEAKMGKTMGVAALVLERRTNKTTRRP